MKNRVGLIILVIILVIAFILFGIYISSYNNLVSLSTDIETSSSEIDNQLKRRNDLIPNLVNTVKGYMEHESDIINSITEARTSLENASSMEDKAKYDEELTKAINNLNVVVENYPDLKSNENFIALQDELAGTENRLAVARKNYNDSVGEYNKKLQVFPSNIVASMNHFEKKSYYEVSESEKDVPQVDFSNK